MVEDAQLSPELRLLQQQLQVARTRNEAVLAKQREGSTIQIPGIGRAVSAAYEQLRKAAEYAEDHVLLQRAIHRFLYRSLPFSQKRERTGVGEELLLELTHAGYLRNSTYSESLAESINLLVTVHHAQNYWRLREAHVSRDTAIEWTLEILSVAIEELLQPHYQRNAIATYAQYHYLQRLPKVSFLQDPTDDAQYDICLYVAIHKALFRSDLAAVRFDLLNLNQQSVTDLQDFISLNKNIDRLYTARLTQRIQRSVHRYGASLRVLRNLADTRPDLPELLLDQAGFMHAYKKQIDDDYQQLKRRINKGLVKSIAFVFITKMLIGLSIEIPYDLLVTGVVAYVPLGVNLLFPPLYMASLRLGLHTPNQANAQAVYDYMEHALYQPQDTMQRLRVSLKTAPATAKVLYTILFLVPLGVMVNGLILLDFNILQGIIFFIFLSTVSFLGFRLAYMIRELQLVSEQPSVLSTLRDFFYLPFIMVGQWVSRKYAKLNIVAYLLDIAVELPLKTFLRLLRQWTQFLSDKQDELL
ncbi:MAG TPA: hypothetical protein VLH86_05630 [Patescibacteria group bacterium]|nr:hypothetical protein [Patescibacteria group bacterium]